MARKLLSIVTPTLNEQDNVRECRDRIARVMSGSLSDYDYEHIFTDNGSKDETVARLREIAGEDACVRVIVNSRNFGAEASILNAVRAARGDAVFVMIPADMQDPPELIPEFVANWEDGYKVVYGVRENREETALFSALRRAYYGAVDRLSEVAIPRNVGEFQLIDRVVVEALAQFDDRRPYLRGMIASCGFPSKGIGYTWTRRKRGLSKMNLYRLVDFGLNGLTSFSVLPIRICLFAGWLISLVSLLYAVTNFFISLIWYREFAEPGIATLIVALFFFGGVLLFFLGVIGEYIVAIHNQVKQRPLVIEAERINFEPAADDKNRP